MNEKIERSRAIPNDVDEAWQHAACLSIAEGVEGWEAAADGAAASPAMRAVAELRRNHLALIATMGHLRASLIAIRAATDVAWTWMKAAADRLDRIDDFDEARSHRTAAANALAPLDAEINGADWGLK